MDPPIIRILRSDPEKTREESETEPNRTGYCYKCGVRCPPTDSAPHDHHTSADVTSPYHGRVAHADRLRVADIQAHSGRIRDAIQACMSACNPYKTCSPKMTEYQRYNKELYGF